MQIKFKKNKNKNVHSCKSRTQSATEQKDKVVVQKTIQTRPAFGQARKRIRNQRQRTWMKGHVISLHVKIFPHLQICLPVFVNQRSTVICNG